MALTFNFTAGRKDLFPNGYTQKQVDSINALVSEANTQGITLKTQMAYILATAYHECYNPKTPSTRLTPMKEFGGDAYLKSKKYYPYIGRGFVQLTWKENYQKYAPKVKAIFGIDIMKHPEALERIDIAAFVAVDGMKFGRFTRRKLGDYITTYKTDFPNARRIINGTDKAELIAGYASKFLQCIGQEPDTQPQRSATAVAV